MSDQTPDLVERLRDAHVSLLDIGGATERDVVADAADEIERLRAALAEISELHYPSSPVNGRRSTCVLCLAADGSWPCTTKIIVNEAGVS